MKSEYTFGIGNKSDLNQIKDLTLLAYLQFRNVLSKENIEAWEADMNDADIYSDLYKIGSCFVCEDENRIIGSAFLIPHGNPFKWFDTDSSYIRLVAVAPKFEGNGIGKKLTQMCIDRAREAGEKVIALHTSEFQSAAQHIYGSIGFVKIKTLDQMFGKKYYMYNLKLN